MDYKDWENSDLIDESLRLNQKNLKNLISMIVVMMFAFMESIISFFIPISFLVFALTMIFCYGTYLIHYFIYKKNKKKINIILEEINKRNLD